LHDIALKIYTGAESENAWNFPTTEMFLVRVTEILRRKSNSSLLFFFFFLLLYSSCEVLRFLDPWKLTLSSQGEKSGREEEREE
jgi:hypothetical protein